MQRGLYTVAAVAFLAACACGGYVLGSPGLRQILTSNYSLRWRVWLSSIWRHTMHATADDEHLTVAQRINARFWYGEVSNSLMRAGVLVHHFDQLDNRAEPWRPCNATAWCSQFADRMSASLIQAAMTVDPSGALPVASYENPGFVLSPTSNKLLCSFVHDGGTLHRKCARQSSNSTSSTPARRAASRTCVPGCTLPRHRASSLNPQLDLHRLIKAWPPTQLDGMLAEWFRRRGTGRRSSNHAAGTMYYNEVVMERPALQRGLPQGSIEAVYYVLLESCQQLAAAARRLPGSCTEYRDRALLVHTNMLKALALPAEKLPLLRLDPLNWVEPFACEVGC